MIFVIFYFIFSASHDKSNKMVRFLLLFFVLFFSLSYFLVLEGYVWLFLKTILRCFVKQKFI